LDYAALSDPLLRIALWAGLGAILVSMLMLVYIVVLRIMLIERQREEQRFLSIWRPIMLNTVEGEPVTSPALKKSGYGAFLKLWNHFQESLRGDSSSRLSQLAVRCGIEPVVRNMLNDRSVRTRLVAIFTLGHLRDQAAWQDLVRLSRDNHPVVSICAARALLQIDPGRALPMLMPSLTGRGDWSIAKVTAMLAESGADAISAPLVAAVKSVVEGSARSDASNAANSFNSPGTTFKLARLLHFLGCAHTGQAAEAILRVLEVATDDAIIAACLRALHDPRGLEIARAHITHPTWFVRIQAARALGRLGSAGDCDRLVALLSDPVWWVRYRAAQAIVALPTTTPETLENVRTALADPFAVDILRQAIAEGAAA
jgi:HEAT repeat protein